MAKQVDGSMMDVAVCTSVEIPHVILLRFPDGTKHEVVFDPIASVPKQWGNAAITNNAKTYQLPDKTTVKANYKLSDRFKNQGVMDIFKQLNDAHKLEIVELAKSLLEDEQAPKVAPIEAGKADNTKSGE